MAVIFFVSNLDKLSEKIFDVGGLCVGLCLGVCVCVCAGCTVCPAEVCVFSHTVMYQLWLLNIINRQFTIIAALIS